MVENNLILECIFMELARVQLKHCVKHSTLKQTQLPLHSLAGRPTKTECQPFTCKNRRYINTNTVVPQLEDLNRALQTWISRKISHLAAKNPRNLFSEHVYQMLMGQKPPTLLWNLLTQINSKNESKLCILKRQSILQRSNHLYMKKHVKRIHFLCSHLWPSNKQDLKLRSQSHSKINWSRSEENKPNQNKTKKKGLWRPKAVHGIRK